MFRKMKSKLAMVTVLAATISFLMLAPTVAGAVEVTFWSWGDWEFGWGPLFYEEVEKFNVEYPDIKITVQLLPGGQYSEKLTAALTAGTGPDALMVGGLGFQLIRQGLLQPWPEDIFPKDWMKNEFPLMASFLNFGGEYYWLAEGTSPWGLYYNRTHLAEAGITETEAPRTWDDLIALTKKLAKYDARGEITRQGIGLKGIEPWQALDSAYQMGGTLFSEDGKTSEMDSPQFREGVQFVSDLYLEHKVASADFPDFLTSFVSELASMTWVTTFLGGYCNDNAPEINWGLFPGSLPPVDKIAKPFSWGQTAMGTGWAVPVTTTPEKQRAAFSLIKFMMEDDEYLAKCTSKMGQVPTKTGLASRPEMQKPDIKVIAMVAPYTIAYGEIYSEIGGMVLSRMMDRILLENVSVDQAVADATAETDDILARLDVTLYPTEHGYTPPADMSVIENWRSGKTVFPLK